VGKGWGGAKLYDGEKAWPSIKYSIPSRLSPLWTEHKRDKVRFRNRLIILISSSKQNVNLNVIHKLKILIPYTVHSDRKDGRGERNKYPHFFALLFSTPKILPDFGLTFLWLSVLLDWFCNVQRGSDGHQNWPDRGKLVSFMVTP
jgi:hypothetical protein